MIGLVRLFCYQKETFRLVEVPKEQAKDKQREMSRQGYVITHTELV